MPSVDYDAICQTVLASMQEDGLQLTPETAWNFMFRYALNITPNGDIHIVESSELAKAIWKMRSGRLESWLTTNLAPGRILTDSDIRDRLGLGFKSAQAQGYGGTPANFTGSAFENGLAFVISKVCDVEPLVRQSVRKFRGFQLAQKAEVEQLDVALFSYDDFRILISCLWTTRKDRLTSDLYEANFLRRRRPDLSILFVVNEFQPNLLLHLLDAPEVDAVYHVSVDALLAAHNPLTAGTTYTAEQLLAAGGGIPGYQSYLAVRSRVKTLSDLLSDIDEHKPKSTINMGA